MNAQKKSCLLPNVNGSHSMTWKELAEADDLATALTVDPYFGFTTHKMTEMKIRISDRIRAKFREIICDFQKHKCYDTAYSQLTADSNIVKKSWSSDKRFRDHITRYLLLFDDRSGVEIRPCLRYASENHMGAAIHATKDWSKGSRINTLIGCIAELKHHEEAAFLKHHQNDYSVMYSSRKNCSQLWLGPASYVNHDCQPNCKFTINCDADARMRLEANTDIKNGDEIFIYYGPHFFDNNNNACECFTCELLGRGYFSKFNQVPSERNDKLIFTPLARTAVNKFTTVAQTNRSSVSNDDTLNDKTGHLSGRKEALMLTSYLRKGSSTGLACKAVSNAYSLRHTGSRLDRVKARIFAAARNNVKLNQIHARSTKNTRLSDSINSDRLESNGMHISRQVELRLPNWETTENSEAVKPPNLMKYETFESNISTLREFVSSQTTDNSNFTIVPLNNKPVWPESDSADGTSSGFGPSLHYGSSSNSDSPLPPPLDRMSSASSGSLVSETAGTPDLTSYYFNQDSCELECNNTCTTLSTHSPLPSSFIDINTPIISCDENAGSFSAPSLEPILGRLLSETQNIVNNVNSQTTSGSKDLMPTKRNRRRLTNYDARLIAEASQFIPETKRMRKPSTFTDAIESLKKSCNKNVGSTPASQSEVISDARPHKLSTEYLHYNSKRLSMNSGQLFASNCEQNATGMPVDGSVKISSTDSSDSTPPLVFPTSLYSSASYTLSDMSQDVGPPSISSLTDIDDKSEPMSMGSELPVPKLDPESSAFYNSPCGTPLSDAYTNSSQCQIKYNGDATLSAHHLLQDHDYSLPVLNEQTINKNCSPLTSEITRKCGLKNPHHSSGMVRLIRKHQTPPPPILQPAIPSIASEYIPQENVVESRSTVPQPNTTVNSRLCQKPWWPRFTSNPNIWSACNFNEPPRQTTVPTRLIVTLKRIGPEHYQITKPSHIYIHH